jgi:hypothetical protein
MTTELVPKLDLADVPLPAIIADIVEFTGSSESPIFQQGISAGSFGYVREFRDLREAILQQRMFSYPGTGACN